MRWQRESNLDLLTRVYNVIQYEALSISHKFLNWEGDSSSSFSVSLKTNRRTVTLLDSCAQCNPEG
jgi:hypothetical protein